MRHLVIAVVVAAGRCFVGALGASAAPANGQAISQSAEQTSSFSVQFSLSLLCQRLRQRPETGTRAVTSAIVDLVRVFALNGAAAVNF